MMRRASSVRWTLALALATSPALAFGILDTDRSARSAALSGAGDATVAGAEAALSNVAGLVSGPEFDAQATAGVSSPYTFYRPDVGSSASAAAWLEFKGSAALAARISPHVALGISLTMPFASHVTWPVTFPARFDGRKLALETLDVAPAISWAVVPRFRLGAALHVMRSTLLVSRALDQGTGEATELLGGAGSTQTAEVGAQVDVVEGLLTLGVDVRAGAAVSMTGNAHFAGVTSGLDRLLVDQSVIQSMEFPAVVSISLALQPTRWMRAFLDTRVQFSSPNASLTTEFQASSLSSSQRLGWTDVPAVHAGVECEASESVVGRAGLSFEPSMRDRTDPLFIDGHTFSVGLGLGVKRGIFTFDVGYRLRALLPARLETVDTRGSMTGTRHQLMLSVAVHPAWE